ncbi:hypothetical protein L5515_016433 [Caenorhabditis briggsae]|uniref:Protein CBR-GAP-2 n=2 Tax=Caenorhabditis briggsae TaxID=6238 RepID=A0AAE9FGX9_CAEBR|nr:hypothetical protein L5515_016433 [Caenorhabditis briggsae]
MSCINLLYCPLVIAGELWAWITAIYFALVGKLVACCGCCRKKEDAGDVEAGIQMAPAAKAAPVAKAAGASVTDRAVATEAELEPMLGKQDQKEDHGACYAIHDETNGGQLGGESLDRRGWSATSTAGNRTTLTASVHNNMMNGRMSSSSHNLSTRLSGSSQNLNQGPTNAYGFPIVPPANNPSDSSAGSRIASIFRLRSNPLKRTKSVSKMEKSLAEANQHTLHRVDAQTPSRDSSLYAQPPARRHLSQPAREGSLRACRSHESLLSSAHSTHMIELDNENCLHPIHASIMDVPNCFRMQQTYYACRSQNERAKWMEHLRRSMNPRRDLQKRTENSLLIWILEGKGLPAKRKYYCEMTLDKTLYGKTSAKARGDNVFWGENFEFQMLPKIEEICISLFRESDSKKKKDTLIGYVIIGIDQLASKSPVERWYTVNNTQQDSSASRIASALGGKSSSQEVQSIRIKARWQSVDVLPLRVYDRLSELLTYNYLDLCQQLEPVLNVRDKEDFATSFVRVMYKQNCAVEYLADLVMAEIGKLDNDNLMFRGNTVATKSMESFMKLVASDYLEFTLRDFIMTVVACEDSCEVDPQRLGNVPSSVLEKNRALLTRYVEVAWTKIINSVHMVPKILGKVFATLRLRLEAQNRGEHAETIISSSIFLRFLCPAILSPSLFNLVAEFPSINNARNLTLIAKTLQNLANFSKFGGKEPHMEFMNTFVDREWNRMHEFLLEISTESKSVGPDKSADAIVDAGKELSLIGSYLEEVWSPLLQEKNLNKPLGEVKQVLTELAEAKRRPDHAIFHSPMVQQPSSDYENSPQQNVVPRHENVPAYRSTPPTGQATVMGRSMNRPATHLMTSDDYVLSSAFQTPSLRPARLSDETGTSSSRTSDKTTSSAEIRDDTDSDFELRDELGRGVRNRKRLPRTDASPSSSQQASSGYMSNNPSRSSYSNSSSSSPVERMAALSIANPVFGPGPSAGFSIPAEPKEIVYQKRASPPPYDPEVHQYHYQPMQVYAVPPDCQPSPRGQSVPGIASQNRLSLPRTNPRASRTSALLRPSVVNVPDDWERQGDYWRDTHQMDQYRARDEMIKNQAREIERLTRENLELKNQIMTSTKLVDSKRSDSGASEDSYDSLSSLDRPTRKSLVVLPN